MGIELQKIAELPKTLNPLAIERAVQQFMQDGGELRVEGNEVGLYQETLESIANASFMGLGGRDFFLAVEDGEVVAFALCMVDKGLGNRLCYRISKVWVHKKYRHTKQVKIWFQQLRERAKNLLCQHITVPSSRGDKAYCRFLGKGWHPYMVMLKEDLHV